VVLRAAASGAELTGVGSIGWVSGHLGVGLATAMMAAENVSIRIIPLNFSFFMFFYSIERLILTIRYRIFKFIALSCLVNGHHQVIDLTGDQFELEGTGLSVNSHGESSIARAGRASTAALFNVPLTDHSVEFGESCTSLQHLGRILPVIDELRDHKGLIDDHVDHEDYNE
jgi:hypothetical protein